MLTIVFECRSASHVQKGTHSIINQQWVLYLSLLNGKRRENSGKYLIILCFCFICKSSCLKLGSTFIFIMPKFYSFILYLSYFYLWNWKIIWFTTFESFFKNYLKKRCFSWEFIQLSQEKKTISLVFWLCLIIRLWTNKKSYEKLLKSDISENGVVRNSKSPPLHITNEKSGQSGQNQLFWNSGN